MNKKITKREKHRYILFKIITENEIYFNQRDLQKSIWNSIWRYFGMKIANKVGLWILEINYEEGYFILRCSHTTQEMLITALTFVKEINGKKLILTPIKTSGTIKGIKRVINSVIRY